LRRHRTRGRNRLHSPPLLLPSTHHPLIDNLKPQNSVASSTKMRNLQTLALAVAAVLGMAHAAVPPQHALSNQQPSSSTHVTMRKTVSMRRVPEIVTVRYRFTAQGPAKDGLDEAVDVQTRAITADLNALPSVTVMPWSRHSRVHNSRTVGYSYDYDHVYHLLDSEDISAQPLEKWQSRASGQAHFTDLASFEAAKAIFREIPEFEVETIDWKFTDETIDAVRDELVVLVVEQCVRSGKRYARALGGSAARIVALDEEYVDSGETEWPSVGDWDTKAEVGVVKEVEVTFEAKCTVVVE